MAQLLITYANGRTDRRDLATTPQVVGRERTCDIFIDDPSTSRRHARLVPTTDGHYIEDLGSKNGSLLNGRPCTRELLRDGDQVLLGTVLLTYQRTTPHAGTVVIDDDLESTPSARLTTAHRPPNLPQQRLQLIYDLSDRLTTLQNRDQLLEEALAICCETLGFERAAIGVRPPESRQMTWPAVRNLRGREGELKISRSIFHRALEHGERAIYNDDDGMADPTVSIVKQGIRSALCVPLASGTQIMGVIYGDRVTSAEVYDEEDMDFLAGIAKQVTIGLINSFLLEEQKRMLRMQQDLEFARIIQRGLFPRGLPAEGRLIVDALNDPGNRVSGDYYDVLPTGTGGVWLLMADVTGEGIPAALLMANLQAAVRVTVSDDATPGQLLTRWNRQVHANTDSSRFVTCVVARIEPALQQLQLASAGHHLPLLCGQAGADVRELECDAALPLGVRADEQYETTALPLPDAPATMVCYTDGVIEALSAAGELFGKGRLVDYLQQADGDPHDVVHGVRKAVEEFSRGAPQSDDITLLAARIE